MRRLSWVSEGWFGEPGSGKTARMAGRALWLSRQASVRGVFYIDPPRDFPDVETIDDILYADSFSDIAEQMDVPPLTVCQFGLEAEPYKRVLDLAVEIGECAVVVDEVRLLAPSKGGKPLPELLKIATMGRHLPNGSGDVEKTHILIGSQRPTDVYAQLRDNVKSVYVSRFRGRATRQWIRDDIDESALEHLDNLKKHDFIQVAPEISSKLPPCVKIW